LTDALRTLHRPDEFPAREVTPARRRLLSLLLRCAPVLAIVAAAWVIRAIAITTDYNIFVDEATYARVADNLATGQGVTLFGVPFDLHPPAGFALLAAVIRVFSLHGGLASVLFGLRPFVALLGAVTCGFVYLFVGRLTTRPAGLAAAAVLALDPFEIRYDSRVMLEAPAQVAAAGSVLLLTAAIGSQTERRSWILTCGAGIAAGAALCTKENFGLVLAAALVLALLLGVVLERAKVAVALAIMICCYLLSQALLIITSGLAPWWYQVGSGLRRMAGVEQTSGFNSAAVHVSLTSRLAADAPHYGVTYLILGLGAATGLWQVVGAVRHRARWRQAEPTARRQLLVALWAAAAAAYLCYSTAFGTLEEQMYYVLLVPGTCTVVIGWWRLGPLRTRHWRKVAAACVVLLLAVDAVVWGAVHATRDDEYRQLLAWAPGHIRSGATVSVTEFTAQFLMHGVVLGQWATVPELIAHHVDYVLLSTTLVDQGYGIGRPAFEQYLEEHAKIAFEATGPSSGELILFDVRAITGTH
jgi:4-amino-4-deoxy-L-arabinose transferase-like glycosyltransferase